MRCFIAIDIDDKTRAALGDLQQRLINSADIRKTDAKWVRPENVHLTLKFLGEVKDKEIVEVCNIVETVASNNENFDLDIESLGCFGGKSARVLWVGTTAGTDKLRHLAEDIEERFALAGWPPETRQFSGHLTICRIKNQKAGIKLAQMTKDYKNFKCGNILVDSISVYQSQLTPTGPIYTQLSNYKLK